MIEVPYTDVAAVAQKPTDKTGIVAMIHMKVSSTARIVSAAARAFSLLLAEHSVVSASGKAVTQLKMVILGSARVLLSPFLLSGSRLVFVCKTPFLMLYEPAMLAVGIKSVNRTSTGIKFCNRFNLLTSRAEFLGRIRKGFLYHRSLPC